MHCPNIYMQDFDEVWLRSICLNLVHKMKCESRNDVNFVASGADGIMVTARFSITGLSFW